MTEGKKNIGQAIAKAMGEIETVHKNDSNQHGGYNFASIDGFIGGCRDAMSSNGLHTLISVVKFERFAGNNNKQWADITYKIQLCHASGEATEPVQSVVTLPITGAQTSGSAQSYALKQFLRGIFMVKTGEKDDPDFNAPTDLETPNVETVAPKTDASENPVDMAELEAKLASFTSQTALNSWLQENNQLLHDMHKNQNSDYNRFYALWQEKEKELKDG